MLFVRDRTDYNSRKGATTEIVLGAMYEPIDIALTLRDLVVNRDWMAAVGLIPFVPRAAGKLVKGVFRSTPLPKEVFKGVDELTKQILSYTSKGQSVPVELKRKIAIAVAIAHEAVVIIQLFKEILEKETGKSLGILHMPGN